MDRRVQAHLSIAILRYLSWIVACVRFCRFGHHWSDLRAGFGDRGRTEELMRPLVMPVLVIDDSEKAVEVIGN